MKDIYLVYNPASGSALGTSELYARCAAAGLNVVKLIPISSRIDRALRTPIAKKAVIAVIGGDGTVSAVARHVARTRAILAPLPGGTFNHFTKDLGIPQDIDEALRRLASARIRSVDWVATNKLGFHNQAAIGLYPTSLETRRRLEDRLGKWVAFAVGIWRALFAMHVYRLRIDGREMRTPFVFIGCSSYAFNEFGIPRRLKLDAGVMTVFYVRATRRRELMALFGRALVGRLHSADNFEKMTITGSFTIESTRRSLTLSHDGEIDRVVPPIRFRIYPKSLRIL